MSYVLYSAIARAGGIDLLLSTESFARPAGHPYNRHIRPFRRSPGPLRRHGGRALIGLGGALTRWGRKWAPAPSARAANTNLKLVAAE